MAEGDMIRNEFIEVHINETTGGIARIKQYGRKPNRLSQQLAFRFPRERTPCESPPKRPPGNPPIIRRCAAGRFV